MDNLFSHAASDAAETPEPAAADGLDPVVCTLIVPGAVARAFVGFTEHTHLWWPLGEHSVFGAGSYVEFEENLVLESADDGRTAGDLAYLAEHDDLAALLRQRETARG